MVVVRGVQHVSLFVQTTRVTRPKVAAVQQRAVGICTTMLCDFVVLAENALPSTPLVTPVLVPEAASSLLMMPLRVGYARA